jgi:hypothetical protein
MGRGPVHIYTLGVTKPVPVGILFYGVSSISSFTSSQGKETICCTYTVAIEHIKAGPGRESGGIHFTGEREHASGVAILLYFHHFSLLYFFCTFRFSSVSPAVGWVLPSLGNGTKWSWAAFVLVLGTGILL